MISLSDNRKFAENQNFQATLYNKVLFPQMWKHCPISVCRTPPGGPLCPHLAPLMRPEEERCSSLIVHSIKRWNGKIPSRHLYLDKKIFFLLTKKIVPLYWAVLTTWLNEFLITISNWHKLFQPMYIKNPTTS